MSVSVNMVVIAGNVTRDPEVKQMKNGSSVCDISLAINRNWKDKNTGEKREECIFADVVLWGRLSEIASEYIRKGSPVLVSGRLSMSEWNDKDTGQKRSKLKVVGETMQLLGGKGERTEKPAEVPSFDGGQPESFPLAVSDSDIPF